MHAHRILRGTGLFIAAVIGMALLGACNYPGDNTPEPGCDSSSLIAAGIPIEDSQISDSLRPTVEWVYDGACEPDSFRIEFAPDGDFGSAQAVVGTTDAGTRTWAPPADLLPVTEYGWHVAAVFGSTIGPYSITRPLWTGPVCDGPYLWEPKLISPDTGSWVTNPSPELRWESRQPDCLVTNYKFEVSTDPTFASSVLSGGAGPGATFDTGIDFLIDCHTYFWRVAATGGTDIVGEYAVDFFHTKFGESCQGQMELASVTGTLWSDVCPAYGSCSGELPAGCECIEGAIAGDGVRQDGEAAIPGVTVRYGTGPCPATGWTAEAGITDANGAFGQWLPAGIYCFWIDEDQPDNDALVKPGWWTLPIAYDTPFGYTVTVLEGEERTGVDFAWQVAPPGAVPGGIGGQLWSDLDADGTLDAGEPGIEGVEVWLSSGACDPAWSNRAGGEDPTTRTNADGRFGLGSGTDDAYQWDGLTDGDYCVVVDPNDGWFEDIMGDGAWTSPVPDAEIAMTTVHLRGGQDHSDVNFGWAALAPGIGGQLWRDLDADGQLDAGEPGIEGVEVWLSSGVCDPAWGNRAGGTDPTTRTAADGRFGVDSGTVDAYQWDSLADGDYCVVVDSNDGWFDDIMGDGAWTYPVADAEMAMTDVRVQDGHGRANVDFGWGEPVGVVGPVGGLSFAATQNLNCRFGPATVYDVIGYVILGETSTIVGRNNESTWVQIENLDRAGTCWVALSGGTIAGDLSTATVIAAPPTPTPKPVPADNQPPSVQVSHSEGATCGTVIYSATASDNVGVAKIKIYVNGELVKTCNNTTSCSFTGGAGSYYATAEDAAHNIATSETKQAPAEYC